MKRFRAAYGRLLEWVVVALMVVLFLEVTTGVIFRVLGASLAWYDEVASHLLAWLTFYGAALASVKRAHIGCPEVVEMMSWRKRRMANIAAQIIVIAFFLVLGGVAVWIMPVLATDALISLPSVSMSVVQSVIPISSLLIVIAEVAYLVELVGAKAPPPMPGVAIADELQ